MNSFTRYLLIYFFSNLAAILLVIIPVFYYTGEGGLVWLIWGSIIYGIGFLFQAALAATYLVDPDKKEQGQACITALGIILLIGFTVCSPGLF